MWATTLFDHAQPWVTWGAAIAVTGLAAGTDAARRRIPNWLTLPAFGLGVVHAVYVGGGGGLADSLSAALLLALPYVFLFVFAGGGAGDAKLMGAVGAWLGLVSGAIALAAVSLSGVVFALAFALGRGRMAEVVANVTGVAKGCLAPVFARGSVRDASFALPGGEGDRLRMPYGLAIFAGVCLAAGGEMLWRT